MQMPLGREWHTGDSHARMIQPDVLTKAGAVIKPLRYKKELSMGTIEKLVAHRESKKAARAGAKF